MKAMQIFPPAHDPDPTLDPFLSSSCRLGDQKPDHDQEGGLMYAKIANRKSQIENVL